MLTRRPEVVNIHLAVTGDVRNETVMKLGILFCRLFVSGFLGFFVRRNFPGLLVLSVSQYKSVKMRDISGQFIRYRTGFSGNLEQRPKMSSVLVHVR